MTPRPRTVIVSCNTFLIRKSKIDMLRTWLIFIGVLFVAIESVQGQPKKMELGIEGGPGIISLRGNDILKDYQDPAIGYCAGLFFQYNFTKLISLRVDLSYERKGSVYTDEPIAVSGNPAGTLTVHSNFDYLTLPVLVRASIGNKVKYFFNAGPYLGYLLKQTEVTTSADAPKTVNNNTADFKPFDVGLCFGLGISFQVMKSFGISAEIRDNLGLYNISKSEVVNNQSIKTNSAVLLIGFSYRL